MSSSTTGLMVLGVAGAGLVLYQLYEKKKLGKGDDLNSDSHRLITSSRPKYQAIDDHQIDVKQSFREPSSVYGIVSDRPRIPAENPSVKIGVPTPFRSAWQSQQTWGDRFWDAATDRTMF